MSVTVTGIRELRIAGQQFMALGKDKFVQVQKAATLDALSNLQAEAPVRTGRLRASFSASAGQPIPRDVFDFGYVAKKDLPKVRAATALSASVAAAQAAGLQIEFGQPSYVVTNLSYAPHVNANHPRRGGFFESAVNLTVQKFRLGSVIA